MILQKVISSGQAGVDECALRAAKDAGLQTGGTCAASNEVPNDLNVTYTVFKSGLLDAYMNQTRANIDTGDGTLALWLDTTSGVRKAIAYASTHQWPMPIALPPVSRKNGERSSLYKPLYVICTVDECELPAVRTFLSNHKIQTLCVIGTHSARETTLLFFQSLFQIKNK